MYGAIAYNAYYMVKDAEERELEQQESAQIVREPLSVTLNKFAHKHFSLVTKNVTSEFCLLLLLMTSLAMLKS